MESETKERLSLGAFLKQVREANELSVEYVADQLKLKLSTIRDLEANEYSRLGGLVYIKGYLRSYARLLHLDIEDQLRLSDHNTETSNMQLDAFAIQQKNRHAWIWIVVLLVTMIILAYGLHFYHEKNKMAQAVDSKNLSVVAPAPTAMPVPISTPAPIPTPTPTLHTIPISNFPDAKTPDAKATAAPVISAPSDNTKKPKSGNEKKSDVTDTKQLESVPATSSDEDSAPATE
jgi:cytoskeleton protein RodZ